MIFGALASTTALWVVHSPGMGGDGTAMTVLFAHRAATSARRAEPLLAQQHSRTKPIAAQGNWLGRSDEQREIRLVMNTANKIKRITAVQKGGWQFQQTTIRTSLRLWQFIANGLQRNMFRCNGFQPGVRVNDGYLQGFSGL